MLSSDSSWEELVAQVREGARPEEALRLREPQENFSAEEFWQRLVVKGVGDTPLSFLPPDLGKLLEGAVSPPQEDLVVLPPCLCLDTVLQPEFAMPPLTQKQDRECCSELCGPGGTEDTASGPPSLAQGNVGLGKREREPSPELCSPHSSPEIVSCSDDVIDLTQD